MTRKVMCAAIAAALFSATAWAADKNSEQKASEQKTSEQKAQKSQRTDKSQQTQQAGAPLAVVLVPIAVAGKQDLGDCWARLYTEDNYRGEQLSLVGPVEMPNMRTPFGKDWSGEFESIAIGPKATVTVYDNENYEQRVARFKAGQRVPELDEKLGFFEQIRSVKIACAAGSKTAKSASGSKAKADAASGGGKP